MLPNEGHKICGIGKISVVAGIVYTNIQSKDKVRYFVFQCAKKISLTSLQNKDIGPAQNQGIVQKFLSIISLQLGRQMHENVSSQMFRLLQNPRKTSKARNRVKQRRILRVSLSRSDLDAEELFSFPDFLVNQSGNVSIATLNFVHTVKAIT